jgi:hypothetical protein
MTLQGAKPMSNTSSRPEVNLCVRGVDLSKIRNKNEKRVADLMERVLEEFEGYQPDALDIEDIYGCTLNQLPARYVQRGTVMLREAVTEEQIVEEIRRSIQTVRVRPNHPS